MEKKTTKKILAVKKAKKIMTKAIEKKAKPVKAEVVPVAPEFKLFKGIKRSTEMDLFLSWIAMPSISRDPATHYEFAEKHKISVDILSDWKKREGFYDEVRRRRREFFKDDAGDVLMSLKRTCLRDGRGADVKVFLNYTEDLKDSTETVVDPELKDALRKISKILPD
jgi:hypothetical protein